MKTVFFDIDTQLDFLYPAGALYVPGAERIVPAIARLNRYAAQRGIPVVSTADAHLEDDVEFKTWPRHCVAGTGGADFHPDLVTSHLETVFSKGAHEAAYSAFDGRDEKGTPLAAWLRERGVDELDVAGIATDYCVRATAISAAGEGFATRVLLGLTAGVDPTTTAESIDAMRAAGAQVTGTPVER